MEEKQYNDEDIEKLWNLLLQLDDEKKQNELIKKMPEKVVNILRTRKNIFNKSVMKNDDRILAFNFINLREKYLKRFAMTSLIGFIFRCCDEWETEKGKTYKSENDSDYARIHGELLRKIKYERPIELCDGMIKKYKEMVEKSFAVVYEEGQQPNIDDLANDEFHKKLKNNKEKIKLAKTTFDDFGLKHPEHYFLCIEKKGKHMSNYLTKDNTSLTNELAQANQEVSKEEDIIEGLNIQINHYQRKCELINEYEKEKRENPEKFANEKIAELKKPQEIGKRIEYLPEGPIQSNVKKIQLTIADKINGSTYFKNILKGKQSAKEYHEKDLVKAKEKRDQLKKSIDEVQDKIEKNAKYLLINRRLCKILLPKYTESLNNIKYADYEPTETEYDEIHAKVKEKLGIDKTREEHDDNMRDVVFDFLNEFLKYNPDNHVKCSYKPKFEDEFKNQKVKLGQLKLDGKITEDEYVKGMDELSEKIQKYRKEKEGKYELSVIPPDDTFSRWNRYVDNHYEELRQATDDIYAEKSEIELMIHPIEMFSGKNAEKNATEWQRKHAAEFEADVFRVKFNQWTFLASWKENRDKRNFYTKESEVLKRIIDQSESDEKLGKELMKKRVTKKKADNIAQYGKDDAGLAEYLKSNPNKMDEYGAKRIESLPSDSTEATQDEKEIAWYNIKPQRKKGKRGFRAQMEVGTFNIPAEDEPGMKGYMLQPEQVQKSLQDAAIREAVGATKQIESE